MLDHLSRCPYVQFDQSAVGLRLGPSMQSALDLACSDARPFYDHSFGALHASKRQAQRSIVIKPNVKMRHGPPALLWFDVGGPDNLAPLLGFFCDELSEVGARAP